jgi:hypothetical protein
MLDNDLTLLTQRRVEWQHQGRLIMLARPYQYLSTQHTSRWQANEFLGDQGAHARREHGRSQATLQAKQSSLGNYALHHLFNSFVGQADNRMNQCVDKISESKPRVQDICGLVLVSNAMTTRRYRKV